METSAGFKILVADDEKASRMALEVPLRLSGYEVTTASGGAEAVAAARRQRFDLVLTDVYMPDLNGLEVLRAIREADPTTQVIVVTGLGSLDLALKAIAEGAYDLIAKPYPVEEMLTLVRRAIRHRELAAASTGAPSLTATALVGHGPQMVAVYKMTAHAARSEATVLIEGESGTGKELIARAIHANGQRASQPFTPLNCSALTETLLESELFGYTKGSFTGANADRPGLFESSNGGTIFLDELATTSLAFQSSLLRVLQEKEVRRLGGRETRPVDVRIIGATNQNLEELVTAGQFRADLFYRLSVLTIRLPPLRERGAADIALLTQHLLARCAKGREIRISEQALDLLLRYPWPGNVRELENTIAHAAAVCTDNLITGDNLPPRIIERALPPANPTTAEAALGTLIEDRPPLAELERRYAKLILAETDGNKTRAAEILGIDRRTVYRLLEIHEGAESRLSGDHAE